MALSPLQELIHCMDIINRKDMTLDKFDLIKEMIEELRKLNVIIVNNNLRIDELMTRIELLEKHHAPL